MIKVSINYKNLYRIYDKIILFLITRHAYKGHCHFIDIENKIHPNESKANAATYLEFVNFDEWAIRFSYMIYIERVLKIRVDKEQKFLPYQYNSEILKWIWLQIKHFLRLI